MRPIPCAWTVCLCLPLLLALTTFPKEAPAEGKPVPKKKAKRTDRHGDPLPPGAVARLGTLRLRRSGSVAVSPDGKLLAVAGGSDKTVRLCDAATGKEVRRLVAEIEGMAVAVAFSPDGKTLFASFYDPKGGAGLRHWNVQTGEVLADLRDDRDHLRGATFALSADGRRFVSVGLSRRGSLVHVWDVTRRVKVREFLVRGRILNERPALSRDGRWLACGWDGVRVYDVATGKEVWSAPGPRDSRGKSDVRALAFSPDGKTLAVASNSTPVHLYNARTGESQRTIGTTVFVLVFSPDSSLLATNQGLWHLATGEKVRQFPKRGEFSIPLAFSPDGKALFTTGRGGLIRRWQVATGEEIPPPPGHRSAILCLAYLPDGRTLASYANDDTARLWDTTTGRELHCLSLPDRTVGYGFNTDGYEHGDLLAASPDGKTVAVCGRDRLFGVGLWNVATGKVVSLNKNKEVPLGVAFTPDGKTLISGTYIAANEDRGIYFWDTPTGKLQKHLSGKRENLPGGIVNVACSPDGKTLAAGVGENEIRLWDLASGKEVGRWTEEEKRGRIGWAITFSPDSQLLASTSGVDYKRVLLWDVGTGTVRTRLQGESYVNEAAFSPDGGLLAAGLRAGAVQLWEAATGQEVLRFRGHERSVNAVAFSPDGRHLASGGRDTTILVWDVLAPGRQRLKDLGANVGPLWDELASDEAAQAYAAACALVLVPEKAVDLLGKHLRPVAEDKKHKPVQQLIADLNHKTFAVREAAAHELKVRGLTARGWEVQRALRVALKDPPSLEARRRVESLLADLEKGNIDTETLRQHRAVQILERIGSEKARQLLETLVRGASWAGQTRDARAALARLQRR